jgi:hypothetical protein
MAGLFHTLLKPDYEETSERSQIAQAANLLQVGEFQLLQLAYAEWHGVEMPAALTDGLFRRYMFAGEVPVWARQYARSILEMDRRGDLDDSRAAFHRYDCDYYRAPAEGKRRFAMAVLWIAFAMAGSLAIVNLGDRVTATSVLPPFFDEETLQPTQTGD